MKVESSWKVTFAAVTGLGSPDLVSAFFDRIGPALEGVLRLGQIGVAVFTCLYIFRKWKAAGTKPRKTKKK